jgi:hypothetical protein
VARSKLPDPLSRRHLVERELPAAQALELANAYLGEGRRVEAVDFLRKAGAADRLAALRAEAIAAATSSCCGAWRGHGHGAERDGGRRWRELQSAGKDSYAESAPTVRA